MLQKEIVYYYPIMKANKKILSVNINLKFYVILGIDVPRFPDIPHVERSFIYVPFKLTLIRSSLQCQSKIQFQQILAQNRWRILWYKVKGIKELRGGEWGVT